MTNYLTSKMFANFDHLTLNNLTKRVQNSECEWKCLNLFNVGNVYAERKLLYFTLYSFHTMLKKQKNTNFLQKKEENKNYNIFK